MKLRNSHDVRLTGEPDANVQVLPEPSVLYLPVRSQRFSFSEILVTEGENVRPGQILARDPASHNVPLLAPRAGTARLTEAEGHITLTDLTQDPQEAYGPGEDLAHIPKDMGPRGMQRHKLRELGAWQSVRDAFTGAVPDPFGTPKALIVSTLSLEPFLARGDVQLRQDLSGFTRGLEHLQELVEYQPMYLVLPDTESKFASKVRETLRGYAFVRTVQIPRKYPLDNFTVLARMLGLERNAEEAIWTLGVSGVLAVDEALTQSNSATSRILSVGGPAAQSPQHVKALPGYPLEAILKAHVPDSPCRVLNGGSLTGAPIPSQQLGLDVECEGLTILHEHVEREFLGFMRPGSDRRSYSSCFLSSFGGAATDSDDTAQWGEHRPCISCAFCEEVCPAGIMPHLIHKYLYMDAIEEVEVARADLCVGCGLCSFVCPSKIDLREEILGAQETIRTELHGEEAPV